MHNGQRLNSSENNSRVVLGIPTFDGRLDWNVKGDQKTLRQSEAGDFGK